MQGNERPGERDGGIVRSEGLVQLIDQAKLDGTPASFTSDGVPTGPYRRFALFLRILSSSTPTTVQFIVEFLEPRSGKWFKYNQGLFASLYYEDSVTATEQNDVYEGICPGSEMRVRAVGVGTEAAKYFVVSAAVELFN